MLELVGLLVCADVMGPGISVVTEVLVGVHDVLPGGGGSGAPGTVSVAVGVRSWGSCVASDASGLVSLLPVSSIGSGYLSGGRCSAVLPTSEPVVCG